MTKRKSKPATRIEEPEIVPSKEEIAEEEVNAKVNEEEVELEETEKPIIVKEKHKKKAKTITEIELCYAGHFDIAKRVGAKSSKLYVFRKDKYKAPVATKVLKEDSTALLEEKGKGCISHAPESLFVTKEYYEKEIERAKYINRL